MGDRAIITTQTDLDNSGACVYLHWSGDETSVRAYLALCEIYGFRTPAEDPYYGFARLCQVIANTFDSGLSVGVGPVDRMRGMADGDNGIYLIDGWRLSANIIDGVTHELKPKEVPYGPVRLYNYAQPGAFQLKTEELIKELDSLNRYIRGGA